MIQLDGILLDLCGNDFLRPYFEREFLPEDPENPAPPKAIIRVVQGIDTGVDSCPDTPGLPMTVLRCNTIVGTGMSGLPMRIASGIVSGRYVQVKENQARISVIHAVDVARAARMAMGIPGEFVLTDRTDPGINELAEALAYRIGNKRLFSIGARWARLWYGREFFCQLTTDSIVADTFGDQFPKFDPVSVVNYLRTHVYDENSL